MRPLDVVVLIIPCCCDKQGMGNEMNPRIPLKETTSLAQELLLAAVQKKGNHQLDRLGSLHFSFPASPAPIAKVSRKSDRGHEEFEKRASTQKAGCTKKRRGQKHVCVFSFLRFLLRTVGEKSTLKTNRAFGRGSLSSAHNPLMFGTAMFKVCL